jgi:hypothetical protein
MGLKHKEFIMENEKNLDLEAIVKSIRQTCNKDSNAYKVTEYYYDLTNGILDDGGIAFARSKVLNIEKYLIKWTKEHPNSSSTIMQPEESAIILINALRKGGLLK